MKPSEIERYDWDYTEDYMTRSEHGHYYQVSDVDPLLAAKDREIERLKKFLLAPLFQDKQRISELEAKNAELKTEIKNWMDMDGWRT